MLTRPFLQARQDGVFGRDGVATGDCVRGNRGDVGDTDASSPDVGLARRVGNLVGSPGNRDRWPSFRAATGLFWPAGNRVWRRTVESCLGDWAPPDVGNGHIESWGSWLPPERSRRLDDGLL